MTPLTESQLKAIMPNATSQAVAAFLPALNAAMEEFAIVTPARQAAFLANVCIESGSLRYVKEIASGAAYEGRGDLGNTEPGDGVRFKGRGLIQVTGRANYAACGKALGLDLLAHPELLERPVNACRSAAWFWDSHKLNALADQNMITACCKKVNGGSNGLPQRLAVYRLAIRELS